MPRGDVFYPRETRNAIDRGNGLSEVLDLSSLPADRPSVLRERLDGLTGTLVFTVFGCSAQLCAANSSMQSRMYFSFISVSELPAGGPVGRNNQAHREHPGP